MDAHDPRAQIGHAISEPYTHIIVLVCEAVCSSSVCLLATVLQVESRVDDIDQHLCQSLEAFINEDLDPMELSWQSSPDAHGAFKISSQRGVSSIRLTTVLGAVEFFSDMPFSTI